MKIRALFLLPVLGAFNHAAIADFAGVQEPPGWNRGDTDTGYLEFDDFVGTTGVSAPTGSGGGLAGTISQFIPLTPPAGLFGDSPDNRIYVHDSAFSFDINVTAQPFDVSTVVLQVKEGAGSGLSSLSPTANGESADSVFVYDDGAMPDANAITRFLWVLDSPITAGSGFTVNMAGAFAFDSYDSFSLDVNAAAVPVPAAVWMFGSALLALGKLRRKNV